MQAGQTRLCASQNLPMRFLPLIFSFCAALTLPALALDAADKPNLIFILADDLGYGDLGCYGRPRSARQISTASRRRGCDSRNSRRQRGLRAEPLLASDGQAHGACCHPGQSREGATARR